MTKSPKEVKRRGVISRRTPSRATYADDGTPVVELFDVTYSYPAGKDAHGRQRWSKVRVAGFHSKAEAEEGLRDLEKQVADGTIETRRRGHKQTAVDYILEVIRVKQDVLGELRAVTADNYRGMVARHIAPALGKRTVAEVDREVVKGMIATMSKQGRAPSTIRQAFAILEGCFGEAVADGLIAVAPTYKVKVPKIVRTRRREFDLDEIRRVLDAAEEPWSPIFTLMAVTGLRRSEALGLTWDDFDPVEGIVKVRRSLHRVGRDLVTTPPKSERSDRDVELDEAGVALLESVRVGQAERLLQFGVRPVPATTPIFDDGTGAWRDPDGVSSAWAKLTKRCGVEGLRLHDLRHHVATTLVDSGYDAETVAGVLGHSSPSFTMTTYVRGRRGRKKQAASTMTSALGVREK